MKKYVFLFLDQSNQICICEHCVEAHGMHDAFTQAKKIANKLFHEKQCPLRVELKGVQYLDAV